MKGSKLGRLFIMFSFLICSSAFAKELPDWGYEVICQDKLEKLYGLDEGSGQETLVECVGDLKSPAEFNAPYLRVEQCIYVHPKNAKLNYSFECAVSSYTHAGSTESSYITREGPMIRTVDNSSSGQPLKFTINGQTATKENDNCYLVNTTKEKFCFYSLK